MSLNAGLTTLHEDDIAKHQAVAQGLVTKLIILEADDPSAGTALAGTGRRFVSTVSTGGQRRTREVELAQARSSRFAQATDAVARPSTRCSTASRRGLQVALAVADVFARQTNLEGLQSRNATAPLPARMPTSSRRCCRHRPISPPSPSPPISARRCRAKASRSRTGPSPTSCSIRRRMR